ncbi:MAG: GNAT family N-acetyltransferase [Bacteroidia bacterium]
MTQKYEILVPSTTVGATQMHILKSKRLNLRQLRLEDAGFMVRLMNSPDWLTNIGDRNIHSTANAHSYLLEGPLWSYATHGFGLYLVSIAESNTPIGICGLLKRDTLNLPDVGIALHPDYFGQGYALEIFKATVDYAHEKLGYAELYAITSENNYKTIKLLEKAGFKLHTESYITESSESLCLFHHSVVVQQPV